MTPLAAELRDIIAAEGPISVERYMSLCLQHPRYGYYTTREPIGRTGDFITAPEVSQMFGELIGLWAAQVWMAMERPTELRLVELGPGRGTLMADALRAVRIVPGFLDAVRVDLVETSPRLEAVQRGRLGGAGPNIAWHRTIEDVPERPAIVIANEFFDALPVRHYVRGATDWHERLVGLAPDTSSADVALRFGVAPEPIGVAIETDAHRAGQVLEIAHAGIGMMRDLAKRIAASGGALLVLDYGHAESGLGETLQAVRGHAFADALATPGEADLTAHVDFSALGRAAADAGAVVHGPVPQGTFLQRLGIAQRAATLQARADTRQSDEIDAALARLTAEDSSMATLFKAMAVTPEGARVPPGFEEIG